MTKLKKNLFLQGASGMLGSQLVYRTVDGTTIVSSRPIRRTAPSKAQQRQITRFKYASIYGKAVQEDPALGPIYEAAAAKLGAFKSTYQLAVTDYLRSPEIGDLLIPSGVAGTVVLVEAFEDPRLAKVDFTILDGAEEVMETGAALLETNGIQWAYTLQQDIPEGGKVLVQAYDLPGNVSTKSFNV